MNRTKWSQSEHDETVVEIAEDYVEQGYRVWADVPGYSKPKPINRHIPDVVAKDDFERIIVEVETEDSVDSKHAERQRRAFERAADRDDGTTFEEVIA